MFKSGEFEYGCGVLFGLDFRVDSCWNDGGRDFEGECVKAD